MSAVIGLLQGDFRMQVRHGFWIAGAFALTPWIAILVSVSPDTAVFLLPLLIFGDISTAGPLFMAGSYFFDRRDGALQAISVTPVRTWEWLTVRTMSMAAVGAAMGLALALIGTRGNARWVPVLIGIVCVNVFYTQLGFVLSAPCARFTDFFLYYVPAFAILGIPALAFAGIEHWSFWILPTQPTLALIRGSFSGMPPGQFAGILVLQVFWIGVAHMLCVRAFHRHVAARAGG